MKIPFQKLKSYFIITLLGTLLFGTAGASETFNIRATKYSLGANVGGPDEMQDRWTNRGYSATGPNLTPGIVAVNRSFHSLGTVFQDPSTGYCYVAGDTYLSKKRNVIDFYQTPSTYKTARLPTQLLKKGVIQNKRDYNTAEKLRNQIVKFCGNQAVPPGESAKDWLNGKRDPSFTEEKSTNTAPELQATSPSEPKPELKKPAPSIEEVAKPLEIDENPVVRDNPIFGGLNKLFSRRRPSLQAEEDIRYRRVVRGVRTTSGFTTMVTRIPIRSHPSKSHSQRLRRYSAQSAR